MHYLALFPVCLSHSSRNLVGLSKPWVISFFMLPAFFNSTDSRPVNIALTDHPVELSIQLYAGTECHTGRRLWHINLTCQVGWQAYRRLLYYLILHLRLLLPCAGGQQHYC